MKTMEEKKYNHIELNNEVTKRKDNGFFDLEKDQEALKVYLEEIHDKMIFFMMMKSKDFIILLIIIFFNFSYTKEF